MDKLLQLLRSDDQSLKVLAIETLTQLTVDGTYNDPVIVDSLIPLLNDEVARIREAAAKALGDIGDARAIPALHKALLYNPEDENPSILISAITAAAESLIKLGWQPSNNQEIGLLLISDIYGHNLVHVLETRISSLLEFFERGAGEVRRKAALVLGAAGNVQAVRPLIKGLEDKDPEIRQACARALGEISDPRAVTPLIKRLDDEYQAKGSDEKAGDVCAEIIYSLSRIGDPRAVEPLTDLLLNIDAETDEYVRENFTGKIFTALGQIGPPAIPDIISFLQQHGAEIGGRHLKSLLVFLQSLSPSKEQLAPLDGLFTSIIYGSTYDDIKEISKSLLRIIHCSPC